MTLADLESRADCERLVRAFYERVMVDPIIGWLFTDIAKLDLEAHIPRITAFWETLLLDARTYTGGAFAVHAKLHAKAPLLRGHFDRWLYLWRGTVDELFAGERAELAKAHADRVAAAFHARLHGLEDPDAPDRPGGLVVIAPYRAASTMMSSGSASEPTGSSA
jgi:hemoglobin